MSSINNHTETYEERERFDQARDLICGIVLYDCKKEVGAYIKKVGHKFSRLHELKHYHFDHSYRKNNG